MILLIGIFLGIIAIGLVKRDNGRWYEYLAAVILTIVVCIGLCLM